MQSLTTVGDADVRENAIQQHPLPVEASNVQRGTSKSALEPVEAKAIPLAVGEKQIPSDPPLDRELLSVAKPTTPGG